MLRRVAVTFSLCINSLKRYGNATSFCTARRFHDLMRMSNSDNFVIQYYNHIQDIRTKYAFEDQKQAWMKMF